MSMLANAALLGIDWGTSNRRAYLLDRDGACLSRYEDGQGTLAAAGQFSVSLSTLRSAMQVDAQVPVLMSGMVGSALGWQEAPYLDSTVPLTALPSHLATLSDAEAAGQCRIVPGYRCRADDEVDVMRGEEIQLLGAIQLGHGDGWIVLPGTHSKWVLLRNGVVERIATYMTGELYASLSAGGTLAGILKSSVDDADAFEAGLVQARRGAPLSNALFRVRARVVTGAMPAETAASFVSGLLIGAEFAAEAPVKHKRDITVIGSPQLTRRYLAAASHFDFSCKTLDPHHVYCSAMARFIRTF